MFTLRFLRSGLSIHWSSSRGRRKNEGWITPRVQLPLQWPGNWEYALSPQIQCNPAGACLTSVKEVKFQKFIVWLGHHIHSVLFYICVSSPEVSLTKVALCVMLRAMHWSEPSGDFNFHWHWVLWEGHIGHFVRDWVILLLGFPRLLVFHVCASAEITTAHVQCGDRGSCQFEK